MSKIIITGGLGSLGVATARAFSRAHHDVAVIARRSPRAGSPWICIEGGDLSEANASERAFGLARTALGGADVLVNIAGAFTFERVGGAATAWEAMFKSNLLTCANMCRAAVSGLSDGGAIVNVGAAAAAKAGPGMGPYAASKAGVARLTESLAAEQTGRVRVNAILPLIVDTPQNRAEMPHADFQSWTATDAVADAIVFLASDAARAITGVLLPVTASTSH